MAARLSSLAVLLLLGGCCLSTVSGELGDDTTGGKTSGRATSGGTTSGGAATTGGGGSTTTTGANRCAGIYCAPSFICDPTNGVCECGGKSCAGNCDGTSGTCVPACAASDGGKYPIIGQSPNAIKLPTATLDAVYNTTLTVACGVPPVQWTLLAASGEPPGSQIQALSGIGLNFYASLGAIEGLPTVATKGGPLELEIQAMDSAGNTGVQNYLLEIVDSHP